MLQNTPNIALTISPSPILADDSGATLSAPTRHRFRHRAGSIKPSGPPSLDRDPLVRAIGRPRSGANYAGTIKAREVVVHAAANRESAPRLSAISPRAVKRSARPLFAKSPRIKQPARAMRLFSWGPFFPFSPAFPQSARARVC